MCGISAVQPSQSCGEALRLRRWKWVCLEVTSIAGPPRPTDILLLALTVPPESKSGSRPRKPPPRKQTRSWALLKLLLLLLLCVACGLVACRVTALQRQPLCTSVNTLYDNALRGLRGHDLLRWVLQTDSQQQ